MATHDHHEPRGRKLVQAAEAAVEAAGEQWTPMRQKVFDVLRGFSKPASAYDVAEALSKAEDRRVAANSVYRILDLFVAANVAQRIESANAYVVNVHPECRHDCIFMICDRCNATEHLDDDRITESLRLSAAASGFEPVRPVIELRGICRRCRTN